jgi:hypothetical protein
MGNDLQKEWSGFYEENCTSVTFHVGHWTPQLGQFLVLRSSFGYVDRIFLNLK